MTADFYTYGEPYDDLSPDNLKYSVSKVTLSLCRDNNFELIELRYMKTEDGAIDDIIVVDSINDQVPSRNKIGIKVRERLALIFKQDKLPEVRALRKTFPIVPHLYYSPPNKPVSLCLYFEPWSTLERTWTPQKHMKRISWWLTETSKGTLHRDDQPLERIFYYSPFEVLLPPDLDKKYQDPTYTFVFKPNNSCYDKLRVIRGYSIPKKQVNKNKIPHIEILMLFFNAVISGNIEHPPNTLGALNDQLKKLELDFIDNLCKVIQENTPEEGLVYDPSGQSLIIINIPKKRTPDTAPENYEIYAFLLNEDLTSIGMSLGMLTKNNSKFYKQFLIGGLTPESNLTWQQIPIAPIEVKYDVTKKFAHQASNISETTSNFKGILSGVGALGSVLADLWAKEAWGEWTIIDNDIIKSHNIIRHIGRNQHIGCSKVEVVKAMMEANYHPTYYIANAIDDSITNWSNEKINEAINNCEFLIDATTTLDVPRDISQKNDFPRSVSVFLSPSGNDSVLLLEASDRSIRLDALEAQYYRGVINSNWGENHLSGNHGNLWVGAGCRDISSIISNENVHLHSAILARQIRLLREQSEAKILIWSMNTDNCAVESYDIPVAVSLSEKHGEWTIIMDTYLKNKLYDIRNSHLPNETGGVILGYIDQKIKKIYIVDILSAPQDSEEDPTGFTRGIKGLELTINEIKNRTANIVGYIGEWHSHPEFTSAYPSNLDRKLIEYLANILTLDGQPALMLIVGSCGDVHLSLKVK